MTFEYRISIYSRLNNILHFGQIKAPKIATNKKGLYCLIQALLIFCDLRPLSRLSESAKDHSNDYKRKVSSIDIAFTAIEFLTAVKI